MPVWKRASRGPITFEAFGVTIAIELEDRKGLEPHVEEILPPGWKPSGSTDAAGRFGVRKTDEDTYAVTIAGRPWLEDTSLEIAIGMLDAQVRLFIAANARDRVFVHAGVVAHERKAIVIPGQSFSGKTTLVAALVRAGASYCSDEYAVLDAEGRVHPYPRRLSIRSDDGRGTSELHAHELGGSALDESVELGLLVLTRFRPGAEWQPERVTRAAGLLALLSNAVPAQDRPEECLTALRNALEGATVLEGERGEAEALARVLLDEVVSASRRNHDSTPAQAGG